MTDIATHSLSNFRFTPKAPPKKIHAEVIEAIAEHQKLLLSHFQSGTFEEQMEAAEALKLSGKAFISKLMMSPSQELMRQILNKKKTTQLVDRKIVRQREKVVNESALIIKEKDILRMKAISEMGENLRADILKAPITVEKIEGFHQLTLNHTKFSYFGKFKIDLNSSALSIPIQESFGHCPAK